MKKIFGVLAFSTALLGSTALSGSAAFAGQNDDLVARLNAVEQENAAIRRENMDAAPKPVRVTDRMGDFFGAYAADLPVAYKARPPEEPGRFTIWVEGGAIWTGGDSVYRDFSLNDFTTVGFGSGAPFTRPSGVSSISSIGGSIPGIFDLNPKIGWEAATGFDYKFANSPWHVSGQFRYGQSGTASGSAASSGTLDPSLLSLLNSNSGRCFSPIAQPTMLSGQSLALPEFSPYFPGANQGSAITACGGSQSISESYKETHWLSDLALGYDIAGHGPTYVQVKGGLRIEEFVATSTASGSQTNFVNYAAPITISGGANPPTFSALSITQSATFTDRMNFLGAGPLIGLEGSARFLGAWSFDYKGDLAVLFGTQSSFETNISRTTNSTPLLCVSNSNFCPGGSANTGPNGQRFVTMLSPDIQAGVSYWFTPNIKLGLSYRIDALIAVKNQKSADADRLILPQRYWHGPRLTLTGTF
jgi:hypothetical protein